MHLDLVFVPTVELSRTALAPASQSAAEQTTSLFEA